MKRRKALITADWHLGKTYNSKSLLPFQKRILEWLVNKAIDEQVEWFIIAGDVYDKRRPNREEIQVFEELLYKLDTAGINILVVAGNHDGDVLTLYSSLLVKHSKGQVHLIKAGNSQSPAFHKVFTINRFSFYALPYINRQLCLEILDNAGVSLDESFDGSPLDALVQHWIADLEDPDRTLIISHLLPSSLTGTEAGSDEVVGQMMPVNPESFKSIKGVFSGHIHRPLTIDPNLTFAGSPFHLHPSDKYEPSALIVTVSEDISIEKIGNLPTIFHKITISTEEDLSDIPNLSPNQYYIFKIASTDRKLSEHLHKQLLENLPEDITSSIEFETGSIPVRSFAETSITHDLHQYTPISLIKTYAKEVHETDLTEEELRIITEILENLDNDEAM
ncbi:MAG: exonuclease subunit SbcD [Chlorobi bacterium]|nr:exonuclease subunit SbcD [Chlorobiota bacterium]